MNKMWYVCDEYINMDIVWVEKHALNSKYHAVVLALHVHGDIV